MTDERDDDRDVNESPREGGDAESRETRNDDTFESHDDDVVEVGGHGGEPHDDLSEIDEMESMREAPPSEPILPAAPAADVRPEGGDGGERRPEARRDDRRGEGRRDERRGDGRRDDRRGDGRRDDRRNDGRRDDRRGDGRRDDRRGDGRGDGRRGDDRRPDARPDPRRQEPRAETRPDDRRQERRENGDENSEIPTDAEAFRDVKRAGRHEPTPEELLPPEDDERTGDGDADAGDREWHMVEEVEGDRSPSQPSGRDRDRDRDRGGRDRRDRRGRDRDRDRDRERGGRDVEELGASTSGIDVLDLPRGGDRRRGIEPGVSLRDLMPFLRPPKHVVILGASTGSGHSRVSHAVIESLKSLDRNMNLRELDLLELLADEFRPAYVRGVLDDLARRPAMFGAPFETADPSQGDVLPADLDEFLRVAFSDRLQQALLDRKPEWVVATHWLAFRWLEAQEKAGVAIPKVVAVVSDFDLHDLWCSPVVKHWLVPSADVERRLVARGIAKDAIHVTGIPVNPAFATPINREEVRRSLGLRREWPTVLVRPGGIGSIERITAVVGRLLAGGASMNLLVVAGRNDKLRESLEALTVPETMFMKAFAFVDNIHELMAVSDILITRATPHTVAEAQASLLPMLLLRPSPGVEERIADRLLANGTAVVARDDAVLESEVADLVVNRRRMKAMRERMNGPDRTDGTGETVERLTRLIR